MNLYGRKQARRALFHTAYFRALSQASTIVAYIVLVRGMTEHDFGVFNLLYAVIPLLSASVSLGLEHVLRRYQPEYLSQGQYAAAAWLVRFIRRARLGTNLVVLALIFVGWHIITPLFKLDPYRVEFAIFSVVILLFFQMRVLTISLSSHMLQQYSVGVMAVLSMAKLAGYTGFVLIGDLSLRNAILVDTLAFGLAYAGLYVIHRRRCALPAGIVPVPPARDEARRLIRYGLPYNFNDVGQLTINSRADNFFIAAIMDPVAVGTYAFYTRLSLMVNRILPVNVFENVVQPVFFAIPKVQAAQRLPSYFTLLLNTNLLFTLPIAAFAAVYHEAIVEVFFGGKFRDDSILLPIVFAFLTLKTVSTPVTLAAQYAEKAWIILISKAFGILNVVMLLLLIPLLGVYGAALATGSSAVLKNAFIWWHVRDTARWLNWKAAVTTAVICWGGFYLIAAALKENLDLPPVAHLAIGALLCTIVVALSVRTEALSTSDRDILSSVLKGREARILKLIGLTR